MRERLDWHSELLDPLAVFYAASDVPPPAIEPVRADDVPEPYRALLVHKDDMTFVLQRFHGQPIDLHVLDRRVTSETVLRRVVLRIRGDDTAVEFGAIRIHLNHFTPEARRAVLDADRPLGAILRDHALAFVSRPSAILRVTPDDAIRRAMDLNGTPILYGRCNVLYGSADQPLAQVVEILPPLGRKTGEEHRDGC